MSTPNDPPQALTIIEKKRIRDAAWRAETMWPNPVGKVVSRELMAWYEFGYVLGGESIIMALLEHVENEWQIYEQQQTAAKAS